MTNDKNKPEAREFYMDTELLDKALESCDLGDGYSAKVRQYPHSSMLDQLTRVIEFSAYQQLEKKLADANEKLEIAKKGLSFYADKKNWKTSKYPPQTFFAYEKLEINDKDADQEIIDTRNKYLIGGQTAREALKKLEEKR